MFVYEVEFPSVTQGHHVYKAACSSIKGESLTCKNDDREEAKEHDEYAVGTYLEAENKLVGHVPMEVSSLYSHFSKPTMKIKHRSK